jgi:hypothetical protein
VRLSIRSLLTTFVLAATPLWAQESSRKISYNTNLWLLYSGDHAITSRTSLMLELQERRADVGRTQQQLLFRPGLMYTLTEGARIGGGYAFMSTSPYGALPAPARYPEHRIFEQIQLTHDAGRVTLAHRYRLEQRWVGVVDTTGGNDAVTDWRFLNRMRYQLRGSLPLGARSLALARLYLSAYDEVMVNFGENTQYNVFDQNRLSGTLGIRVSKTMRVEAGYLDQLSSKSDGQRFERNRTLVVQVFSNAPLRGNAQ